MTSAILDSLRNYDRPSAAGIREVAREQGGMLQALKAGRPAARPSTGPTGQMFIPADLSYATVDAMIVKLSPCTYALRKVDGSVTFFEVSEYRGNKRIQMLVGAPGSYQRYPMKLKMQFMAITHILDDPATAIKLFADEANCCSRCHSPLTDATSRATGLGPVCRTKL